MAFMPENAPLLVLSFLGTCFVVGVGLVCVVVAVIFRWPKVYRAALAATAGVIVLYSSVLLLFSWKSRDQVLALGQPKYFCEIDCHLAYILEEVKSVESLGTPPEQILPAGKFFVAKLKVWFDERTISPRRGNGPLNPGPRWVAVVDEYGTNHELSETGMKALQQSMGQVVPMTQPLRPGESFVTYLVFELPKDVKNPRLLITDRDPIAHFLINHEESFFHKKIFFQLSRVDAPSTALLGPLPPPCGCGRGPESLATAIGF